MLRRMRTRSALSGISDMTINSLIAVSWASSTSNGEIWGWYTQREPEETYPC